MLRSVNVRGPGTLTQGLPLFPLSTAQNAGGTRADRPHPSEREEHVWWKPGKMCPGVCRALLEEDPVSAGGNRCSSGLSTLFPSALLCMAAQSPPFLSLDLHGGERIALRKNLLAVLWKVLYG